MSRKSFTPVLVAVAVLVLAFVLNPSPERHRLKVKEAIAERNPIARTLGVGSLVGMASSYHSLGVASYTKVGERTLSIGVLGIVYVP